MLTNVELDPLSSTGYLTLVTAADDARANWRILKLKAEYNNTFP
jgi:hypothetical protein